MIAALLLSCFSADAPSAGWWVVKAPQGYVAKDADASVVANEVAKVWAAPQQGVTLGHAHHDRYFFYVTGADMLELRFDRSVRGLSYDSAVYTSTGQRLTITEHGRVADDSLRVEWGLDNVMSVEVKLHVHGRQMSIQDYRVGTSTLLAAVKDIDPTFKRAEALYFYVSKPRSVRVCRASRVNELDKETLHDRIAQPTTLREQS